MRHLLRITLSVLFCYNLCAISAQTSCPAPPGLAGAFACSVCDFETIDASTAGQFPSNPGGDWCGGVIDNDQYFGFVAGTTGAVQFEVTVGSCASGSGIQLAIFDPDGGVVGTCISTSVNPGQSQTLTAGGLTPGAYYLLGIDGFAGAICDFTITPVSGLLDGGPSMVGPVLGPEFACWEEIVTFSVDPVNAATGYFWEIRFGAFTFGTTVSPVDVFNPISGSPDPSVTLELPEVPFFMPANTCDTIELEVFPLNPCFPPDPSVSSLKELKVCRGTIDTVRRNVCFGEAIEYPAGSGNFFGPDSYFAFNTISLGPGPPDGCEQFEVLVVTPEPPLIDATLRHIVLCEDDDFDACEDAVPNAPTGAFACNIPNVNDPDGCDTSVIFYVTRLNPEAFIESLYGNLSCGNTADTLYAVTRTNPAMPNPEPSSTGDSVRYEWTNAAGDVLGTDERLIVGGPGTFTLTVTMTSQFDPDFSCSATATASVTDGRIDPAVPTITGPLDPCRTDVPVVYTASGANPGDRYVWRVTPTNVLVSFNANELVITDMGGESSYQVCASTANGCDSSDEACVSVTVREAPVQTAIDGPTELCEGADGTYTLANFDASYTYTVSTTIPGGTATLDGDEIDLVMGAGAGDVCVEVSNDCGSLDPVCFSIDLTPAAVNAQPTGPEDVCLGDTGDYVLYTTLATGSTVDVSVVGGTITSENGPDVVVEWTTPGIGTVCVTTTNACGTTSPACVTVTVTDPGSATLSGGGEFCTGDNQLEIQIDFTGDAPYEYTYEVDGVAVSGTATSSPVIIDSPAPGEYELVSFVADGCPADGTGTVTVTESQTPTATLIGAATICEGETADLQVVFTGTPDWTFEIALDGVGPGQQTSSTSPAVVPVGVAGTYSLISVESSAGCVGAASGSAILSVVPALTVTDTTYECSGDAETYTVQFTLAGGDPSTYQVEPAGSGSFSGNVFTSNDIPQGTTYDFVFSDDSGCPGIQVTDSHDCPCITQIGTLAGTQVDVCVPGNDADVSGSYDPSGEVLDTDDVRVYVLHTGDGTTITGAIATNSTGVFAYDPGSMSYGVTYYVSVVVGNADGAGGVDLDHRCTRVAAGVPVVFTEAPTATLVGGGTICENGDTTVTVVFTGQPPFELSYEVDGAPQTVTTSVSPYTIDLLGLTEATTVSLTGVTGNGCDGAATGSATINVSGEVSITSSTACNNTVDAYRVTIVITGGDPGSYAVDPPTGTLSGDTFVSDEIPQGTGYSFSVRDQFGCNVEVATEQSVDCACISDAGTVTADTITVCGTDPITIANPLDTAMDANDLFTFILHNGSGPAIGSTVYAEQTSGTFAFDPAVLSYGTVYYISPVMGNDAGGSVDQNDRCLDVGAGTPVRWLEQPEVVLLGDQDVCIGEAIDLTFAVTSGVPVTVVYTNGTQTWTEVLPGGTTTVPAPLNTDETYTIVSAEASGCSGIFSGTATVNVHDSPAIGAVVIDYNSTVTQYTVTFDISGGDTATYTVDGVPLNGATTFTSDFIDCGLDYTFVITDQWDCNPVTLSSPVNCDCVTRIGSISSDFASCDETEPVNVTYDAAGEFLDGNDAVEYILHTGDYLSPLQRSSSPQFSFDPATMSLGTTYFITAVAGDATGGVVVLGDDCTVASNQITAVWSDPPVAFLSGGGTVCPGVQTELTIDVTGPGNITVVYSDGTNLDSIIVMQGREVFPAPSLDSADYQLVRVYSDACPGSASGTAEVRILSGITVSPARVTRNSTNTGYVVEFSIMGGDPATYTVDGTPLNGATEFASAEIPCGTPYSFAFDDAGGCSPIVMEGNPDCDCETSVGSISGDFETCDDSDQATVAYDPMGEFRDGDDAIEFLLYLTDPASPVQRNNSGTFGFDPATMTRDVVYNIVAVAGNAPNGTNVDLNDPCRDFSVTTTAIWHTVPAVSATAPTAICEGETWDVTIEVTGSGEPKTVTYTLDGVSATETGIVAGTPRVLSLPISSAATFALVSVEDANCSSAATLALDVTVGSEITFDEVARTCNGTETAFVVSFAITGGDAGSYDVTPAGTLTATTPSTATFTSEEIPNGGTYAFTITDASGCFSPVVEGIFACNCVTDAGTMAQTTVEEICLGTEINATHVASSFVSDADDILLFALRTDDDQGNYRDDVIEISDTPIFSSASLTVGETYYVSPIAGNDDGTGTDIQSNDPCQSIGISTPFFIHPDPTGSLEGDALLCETQSGTITIILQGDGPFDVVIGQGGDIGGDTTLAGITSPATYIVDPNNPGTYILRSVTESSDPRCSSNPNSEVTIEVEELVSAGVAADPLALCADGGEVVALSDRLTDEDGNGAWTSVGPLAAGPAFDAASGQLVNSGLSPGTYSFNYTVGDGFPCPTDDAEITIEVEPSPVADAGVDAQLTCDEPVATIGTGGDPSFTYQWTGGNVDAPNAATTTSSTPGTYTLLVTAPGILGCEDRDDVIIESSGELPTFDNLIVDGVTCFGDTDGQVQTQISGGTGPFEFSLSGSPVTSRGRFIDLAPGEYDLQVIDAEGCEHVERIIVDGAKEVVVDAGPDTEIQFGEGHEVTLYLEGDIEEVRWTGDSLLCLSQGPLCDNALLFPQFSGTYQVEVIDSNGCKASDFIQLLVNKERPVFIPSAFSPDGDQNNDLIFVRAAEGVVEAVTTFRIFDRWGEVMFSRGEHVPNDPAFGWDGRLGGEVLNPGVFVYWCEVRYTDGETEIFRGDITLTNN